MEPYADVEFYKNQYGGTVLKEDAVIKKALKDASLDIDLLTMNRIVKYGMDMLSPMQKERVKTAVCEQADFKAENSEFLGADIKSYKAGDLTISFGNTHTTVNGVQTTERVIVMLRQTGLSTRRL